MNGVEGGRLLENLTSNFLSAMCRCCSLPCPAGQAGSTKSGSGSFSPDKQKVNGFEGALCLLNHSAFDLEGLATATRQVRHLRVKRPNVAHHLPRGKRAPGTEINSLQEQLSMRKTAVFLKKQTLLLKKSKYRRVTYAFLTCSYI
ncbi:hypothetical protein QUF49_04475 [Fictibacillus sp. b24]|uniref:hypothetical protein n=1 Tax=Fictibacillus sp. b24 TaxID=3055863 RepID=UPI0025A2C6E6|nr:hypothetical protein [Fictibacillus sp. b24]MDM5315238.1 hypothetical protein [Fictibacillus sp. b24]